MRPRRWSTPIWSNIDRKSTKSCRVQLYKLAIWRNTFSRWVLQDLKRSSMSSIGKKWTGAGWCSAMGAWKWRGTTVLGGFPCVCWPLPSPPATPESPSSCKKSRRPTNQSLWECACNRSWRGTITATAWELGRACTQSTKTVRTTARTTQRWCQAGTITTRHSTNRTSAPQIWWYAFLRL